MNTASTSAISYISANSNSPILNSILAAQAHKLMGRVYPLVKQLAKANFCCYLPFDQAVKVMIETMSVREVNGCINYFNGNEFKKSNLYCKDFNNKFYMGMLKEDGDMIYYLESPILTPKLSKVISACIKTERFSFIAVFNYFIANSCYLIGDNIIKEELRKNYIWKLEYLMSEDYTKDYHGNVIREPFDLQAWKEESCKMFKANVSQFDCLGRHTPSEYINNYNHVLSSDEWLIVPTYIEHDSQKFHDMFVNDKEFLKALGCFAKVAIRKTKEELEPEKAVALIDAMYEAYVSRLWGFEVPEQ